MKDVSESECGAVSTRGPSLKHTSTRIGRVGLASRSGAGKKVNGGGVKDFGF